MTRIGPSLLRLLLAGFLLAAASASSGADPLPSWRDGAAKAGILAFVHAVTTPGPGYVVPERRIAVFDNDGTLWCEQPVYFQFAFALDRVKAMAPQHPEWKTTEPFASVLAGGPKGLLASGERELAEILAVTHAGMTTDAFASAVQDWLARARHPRFGKPYAELAYQPMLELLAYLRASGFKTFIVSGGGVEFMRGFAEDTYGIPPEQVVGSSGVTRYEVAADGKPAIVKTPKVEFVDDGPGKPVGINRFIGRRPILAFGNSDGDRQMLEWVAGQDGPHFVGLVHHTDAEREYAYDRDSPIGRLDRALDEALAGGWTVVDMKKDWRAVFAFQQN